MPEKDRRTTAELFRKLFSGRVDVFGTHDMKTGKSYQVKEAVTDRIIVDHLDGRRFYGVYPLVGELTSLAVADFDDHNVAPVLDFVHAAEHYGLPVYIETSKSKGFHVWAFAGKIGVNARKARAVFRHILEEIGHPKTEVFPKQDVIVPGSTSYGNFINAPLFGKLVPKGRTVFVSPNDFEPYPNQWEFLDTVELVSDELLDTIIEVNEIPLAKPVPTNQPPSLGVFKAAAGLPPCARRMLAEGVTANQRVACFRLAVHCRKVGLPFDLTVHLLSGWAQKNRPESGKGIITHEEIKGQVSGAYLKEYRGCGCEDPAVEPFCDSACPIYEMRDSPPLRLAEP
jgi:hypothetical protein